jgi:glutamate-1-semialdehyde 2,1-aminomutase
MPISVFAGKREIMADIAPLGQAQHSGTYPGHLTAVMAANAVLDEITQFDFYEKLLGRCDDLYEGIREIIARTGVRCWLQAIGAEFCLLFGLDEEPTDYATVAQSDTRLLHQFSAAALRHGIHFHSGLHLSMSSAHTKEDVDRALEGIEAAIREIV